MTTTEPNPSDYTPHLTAKQESFCQHYAIHHNGTQAAIAAGYSEDAARFIASENLTKPDIRARLAELEEEAIRKLGITREAVLAEMKKLAFSDMRKLSDWGSGGVTLKESTEIDDDSAAAVSEVSQSTSKDGGSIRFKLHDKKGALELLGKYLSMWTDKMEVSAGENASIRVTIDGQPLNSIPTDQPEQAKEPEKPTENAA